MSMPTTPWSMMVTRGLAVSITFGAGAAGFVLSFTALRDLASRGHIPNGQAWLWPLMVDGAILLATLGVVVMAGDPQCRNDRRLFWLVLCGSAVVSIACNALHATLPPDQPLNTWLRGVLAAVAPSSLLVTTHGLTLLTRMHRRIMANVPNGLITYDRAATVDLIGDIVDMTPTPEAQRQPIVTSQAVDPVEPEARSDKFPVNIPTDSRWHTLAPRLLERLSLKNAGRTDVAQVLYLSYELALADRDIGRRLGLGHHTVGKIVRAADAHVLREHQDRALSAL